MIYFNVKDLNKPIKFGDLKRTEIRIIEYLRQFADKGEYACGIVELQEASKATGNSVSHAIKRLEELKILIINKKEYGRRGRCKPLIRNRDASA